MVEDYGIVYDVVDVQMTMVSLRTIYRAMGFSAVDFRSLGNMRVIIKKEVYDPVFFALFEIPGLFGAGWG